MSWQLAVGSWQLFILISLRMIDQTSIEGCKLPTANRQLHRPNL
jgi:hypothetical protein